jgi:hypothetical protein
MPYRTTATRRNTSSLSLCKVTTGCETSHLIASLRHPFYKALTCFNPFLGEGNVKVDHAVQETRPQEVLETI